MRIKCSTFDVRCSTPSRQNGFTLIEMVVFLVVVSLGLAALMAAYNQSVTNSVDPIVRTKLPELAQSQLDAVMARKYAEETPTGAIPACGSAETGAPATCSFGLDSGESLSDPTTLDDVDDFNNYSATVNGYTATVTVVSAGTELGLADNSHARRISVTATAPGGEAITLSGYRANF